MNTQIHKLKKLQHFKKKPYFKFTLPICLAEDRVRNSLRPTITIKAFRTVKLSLVSIFKRANICHKAQ